MHFSDLPYGQNRSKDIIWIVSHCKTDSLRENIVSYLKNVTNLKIDIFGKCRQNDVQKLFSTQQSLATGNGNYKSII